MPSHKQLRSRERNHRILRLRGAYATIHNIGHQINYDTGIACQEIDVMLEQMGAESESSQRERLRREYERHAESL